MQNQADLPGIVHELELGLEPVAGNLVVEEPVVGLSGVRSLARHLAEHLDLGAPYVLLIQIEDRGEIRRLKAEERSFGKPD